MVLIRTSRLDSYAFLRSHVSNNTNDADSYAFLRSNVSNNTNEGDVKDATSL